MSIFEGLEQYGFEEETLNLYDEGSRADTEHRKIVEQEGLYEKNYVCPVCKTKFKEKAVRSSRQRIVRVEYDLRPVYDYFEMYKYDVVVCTKCGYAALNTVFSQATPMQQRLILEKISRKFQPVDYGEIYNLDTAILRFKLALLNAVVKNATSIEKAALCLKLRWLYASKVELAKEEGDDPNPKDQKQLKAFTKESLKVFTDAFVKGNINDFGFDESKVMYIIGELYNLTGKYAEAYEWLSRVVFQASVNHRLKEKAKDRVADIKKKRMSRSS